jgi:hypothetical protein
MKRIATLTISALLASLVPFMQAHAALDITYFTIASGDPDANHLSGGVVTNEVQAALGPDGLPVLNIPQFGCVVNCYSLATGPGFPSGNYAGVPNANVVATGPGAGEITYWDSLLNPYVTQTLQTTTALPFSVASNFFPPNGTGSGDGGSSGYQAATISGTLTAGSTEQLSFNIGSDDMAFAFIDGQLVCSDGGVHGSSSVPCLTPTVQAGTHTLNLFFVDINQVQSGLTFSINTQDVTTNPIPSVPEPSSLALLAVGLAFVAIMARRRAPNCVGGSNFLHSVDHTAR